MEQLAIRVAAAGYVSGFAQTRWVSMGLVLHQFRLDAGILPTAAMAKQDDDTSNCCEKGRTAGNGVVRRTYFRLRDRRRWNREGEGDAMARGKPTLWHAFGQRLARMKKTRRQTGWPRWERGTKAPRLVVGRYNVSME